MTPKFARKLLLCALGCVGVAQAAPVELEVLGRIVVHTEVELTADGKQIVEGRLTDEVGKPVSGELAVASAAGRPLAAEPCPWIERTEEDESPQARAGVLRVGAAGEFCFLTDAEKGVVIRGRAEHFMATTHDLDIGAGRLLARPRFVQAPAKVDLNDSASHVVEVLGRSERNPPDGSRLVLSLQCDKAYPLKDLSLADARLLRIEFRAPQGVSPGACQFVAEASAPQHKPLRATRSVQVRDLVHLQIDGEAIERDHALIAVKVTGSARAAGAPRLNEGLVEARENGAFVALAPVKKGRAQLEIETIPSSRALSLVYVPATASYVAGDPISHTVPARAPGFRWAGIHTVGLVLFALWLGYAWLRPRTHSRSISDEAPPKRAVVKETGKRSGPIGGSVRDAHTGAPLTGMTLVLHTVGAESTQEVESKSSDEKGEFQFNTRLEDHPLLKLEASGDDYMSLQSATRSASVSVHLTHRRRALVSQLVVWARRAGRPWNRPKSPTPGSVEATASARADQTTADWARSVGQAAYAPGAPSEETVEALREPSTLPGQGAS